MVLTVEYRIPMPLDKSEYEIGQLYGVARLSAKEGEQMAKKGASGEAGGGVSHRSLSCAWHTVQCSAEKTPSTTHHSGCPVARWSSLRMRRTGTTQTTATTFVSAVSLSTSW